MAEKIVYDIEMKGLESAKKNLEEITKAQYEQRNAIKETTTLLKAYEKELAKLETEVGETGKATQEQINLYHEFNKAINETVIQLDDQKSSLTDLNKQKREQTNLLQAHNTVMNAEIGSNEQLRAQLKILTSEYDKMSQEERENTDVGRELAAETLNITNKLKENEKAVGDNRRNVGNYEAAITSALGKINIMGVNLGELTQNIREGYETGMQLVDAMKAQAAASQATAVATRAQGAATVGTTAATGGLSKAMNFLKIALISTGIGAIVVALGLLVAGFLSTQRGADAVTRVLEPLKAIVFSLWGVVQKLGIAMVDAFKNPQQILKNLAEGVLQNVINRFTAIAEIVKGIINLDFKQVANGAVQAATGVKDITDKIQSGAKATKEFMDEAIKKGQQIASLQKQIEQGEIDLIKAKDEYEDRERELQEISKDSSKSFKERQAAVDEIVKITEEYSKQEAKVLEMKIEQLKVQQSMGDASREDAKKMEELQSDLDNVLDKAAEKRLENIKVTNGLKKEQNALIQEAINLEKERLASIAEINRTTNDQLKFELDEKLKILKLNRDDSKLSKDELAAKIKLTQDYYAAINQGELERLDKIREFIATDEEKLANQMQAQLEEFGLIKDFTQMTELELKARFKIQQEYNDNVSKLNLSTIEKQLQENKDYLIEDSMNLKLKYLEDLNALGNNEEAKKALMAQYQKEQNDLTIASMEETVAEIKGILDLNAENEKFGILDNVLNDTDKQKLLDNLKEAELAIEDFKAQTDGTTPEVSVVTDPNAPKSLADRLGIDADKVEEIKAGYQAAVDAIQTILANANQRIAQQTDERVARIDASLKAGTISEQQAEAEKTKVRKEGFEKQKKLQKASATINYFTGLINAVAQAMQFGFPANLVIGTLTSGILTGVYRANMAQIESQKFEDGGLIQGAPHSKGGVPFTVQGRGGFEAEGGEFIQNKKAVQHYGTDFMQAVNTMKIPKLFADGGFIAPVASGSMSSQVRQGVGALAESITSQENRVILVESDLRKTQNKVNNVEAARTY